MRISQYRAIAIGLLALFGGSALDARAQDLVITFYGESNSGDYYDRDGFALIQDERDIEFTEGRTRIEWPGVSSEINPATVTFSADAAEIIEQNFDYDLLTPKKLLEKSVGETVELIRINPATGEETRHEANVIAVNQGAILEIDGRIEVLREDDIPTRVIFDRVPDNLRSEPTLSIVVYSEEAGTRSARLTYISDQLSWDGDYVALFDEDAGRLDLQGWATIANNTSTRFEDVRLSLAPGRSEATASPSSFRSRSASSNADGALAQNQQRIGDTYIFTVPERTTVASNQSKQISIIDAEAVTAAKVYEFDADTYGTVSDPQNVAVKVAFSNTRSAGLGQPLPAGTVRVYTRDSTGRAQFIGADEIGNAPVGADLTVETGDAFDITVLQTAINEVRRSEDRYEVTMKYVFSNASPENVTVRLNQAVWRSWWDERVINETQPHLEKTRSDRLSWDVDIPAEGETTLEFTVVYERPE